MEPLTDGARLALLAVIALLLVTLGFLFALAWMARRAGDERSAGGEALRRAVGEGEGEGAAARADRVAEASALRSCPTCGNVYGGGLMFCPRDARRLVDADELGEGAPLVGGVCPRCQRGFPAGTTRCQDDGADLVPAALAAAFSPGDDDAGEALGKICPRCKSRQAEAASFCGHDGARLVALN